MFEIGDIVVRKERDPKHHFIVIGFDKDDKRLMIIKWLINFNEPNIHLMSVEQLNREVPVPQEQWDYEENYGRKLKLIKLRKKCVK